MVALVFTDWINPEVLIRNPWLILPAGFLIWMLVDAVRREEWLWVFFLILFPPLNMILYYFLVYRRESAPGRGFELPGSRDRRRMRELEAQIHHLDRAHHHLELGDIYLQQGKLAKAEASYRAAIERDAEDLDAPAHLGLCLLRQRRAEEALPLLEKVRAADPKHEYGYSLMALAEAQMQLGDIEAAVASWRQVLENHSYARARVQLAELYAAQSRIDEARSLLEEVLQDDRHAPAFQRSRERVWVRRAQSMLRRIRQAGSKAGAG